MPNIYHDMIQPKGAAYRASQLHARSHYLEPIDETEGRLSGNSRIWGDADPEVQSQVIDILVATSKDAGLSARETAHVLAIARVESGFNPDAAAGTTSASGVGQFIDNTGSAYGLDNANRFDADAQARALVSHFVDNRELAARRGQDEVYIYKYHHDGPSRDYGGLALSADKVMPLLDSYTRFVETEFVFDGTGRQSKSDMRPGTGAAQLQPASELLREGQRSHGVRELQGGLSALGFTDTHGAPLEADGIFGSRTADAVRAFQGEHGLQMDGVVGPLTRDALGHAVQAQSSARPVPGNVQDLGTPLDTLLAVARQGDPDALQAALDAFSRTSVGQDFHAAANTHPRPAQPAIEISTQEACGPER